MDEEAQAYIDQIAPEHRPLFDRLHGLILAAHPEADVAMSYRILGYRVGRRRLYVGAWQHGVSIYGWPRGRDGGFTSRHPGLLSGKATIRLRPRDAAEISDTELGALVRVALEP
jgi:hypothetical protein